VKALYGIVLWLVGLGLWIVGDEFFTMEVVDYILILTTMAVGFLLFASA
jgi:hypothetical protein